MSAFSLQAKDFIQAYHKAFEVHNFSDGTYYPGHIAVTAQRIVAQGDGLARRAKYDLVVGAAPGHAHAMYADTVVLTAAGP